MIKIRSSIFMAAAGLAVAASGGAAEADAISDFYKNKQVSMIIASGVGGGYDTYSRTFARHLERKIPGNPKIVAKNMPGAGGLRATNFVYSKAERDGSLFASTYNTMTLEPLFGNKGAKFDVFKLNWLGSLGKLQAVCVSWHTSPIKTLAQAKGKTLTVSATGATGNSAKMPLLFNWAVDTKFKVILGYSTTGSHLALERGEVDGICGLGYSTLKAARPDWIVNKRLNYLAQIGLYPHPALPDVPMVLNDVKDAKTKKVMELILTQQEPGRPFIAPPGVPKDRVQALRTAFMAAAKDPAFLADAERAKLEVTPMSGEEIDAILRRAYDYPRDVVEAAAKLVGPPAKGTVTNCNQFTKEAKWCRKAKKKKAQKKS
jgi:tripartite-type tricarboxylate transporter receptor subunit TctC